MSSNQKSRHNSKSGRQNSRQNNRNRNQGGRGRKGPGKKQSQQPLTATKQIDSHSPAGKLRGNVKQLYEKYKALAHENRTKDRTDSEAYGQYAHHYYTLYSEFAAAEAAQQVEREKEKARKMQEAAENQSNVVSILDDDENDNRTEKSIDENLDTSSEMTEDLDEAPKTAEPKKKRTRSRKKTDEVAPELPLGPSENDEKPAKPKRARKQPSKVKEDVAE